MNKHLFSVGRVGLIVLVLGLIVSGAAAQDLPREFPAGLHWKQLETGHFIILFDENYRAVAENVAEIAEPIHQDVTGLLESAPKAKTYVILADHVDESNGYASPLPDNRIVLYLKEPGAGTEFFGLYAPDWLKLVLTHEYTHIVQLDMVEKWFGLLRKILGRTMLPNATLPMWAIEGLAVYTETKFQNGRGRHPYYDMMMRTELLEDRFKKYDQMAAIGLRPWPLGTVCYLYGYFFVQYLADTYGEATLAQFNHKNAAKFPVFAPNRFKQVYQGKGEFKLRREWINALIARYQEQAAAIKARPVTATRPLTDSGYYTGAPVFAPDGQFVYYLDRGPHAYPALAQVRLSDQQVTRLAEGNFAGDFSLSADGRQLYFCKTENYHIFSEFSDLYVLDVARKRVTRLTNGLRAFDPAVAPDGKTLVFTTNNAGSMNLMQMNLETKAITPILETTDHTQIKAPAFSADGARLAVQIWKEGGLQDIYVMNRDGSGLTALTFDAATDAAPAWGLHDEYIFFSSDRTGVPNIFAYSLQDQKLYQVTNVLSGAFQPAVAPDGTQLALELYSGNGMDIHLAEVYRQDWQETAYTLAPPAPAQNAAAKPVVTAERGYNPLPSLLPKFWLPTYGIDEDGFQLGINTVGQDVLAQHYYDLSVLYGLSSSRVGFYGLYRNTQFFPAITLFASDAANVFSDLFANAHGNAENYWQREQVAGLTVSLPVYRSQKADVAFSLGYRYKNLKPLTDLAKVAPTPDEGQLSGLSAGVYLQHLKSSIYAISPESGFLTSFTYRRDDQSLGSDFNLNTYVGDVRAYLPAPFFRHHILALRATGGVSEGDVPKQGVFQLGGFASNSVVAVLEQQRFFLRGYETNALAGERFALGSAEYRFPIWFPQRAIDALLTDLFVDSITGAVFYDFGNAWTGDVELSDFKSGVGAELRVNLKVSHAIPLTIRLGFAKGLDSELGKAQFIGTFGLNFWL